MEQHRDHVGQQQGREHHPEDDPARQPLPEDPHRQVGGQEDERKAQRPPGGVHGKTVGQRDGERELHQVVAGGDDGNVKEDQPPQGLVLLGRGEGEVVHAQGRS